MTKTGRRVFMIVGAIVVALVLIGLVGRMAARPRSNSTLEITLAGKIIEEPPADPIGRLLHSDDLTVRDHVEALYRARDDRHITRLLVTIDAPKIGLARAQELRDAILEFQTSNKPATCYLETAGEFSPGNKEYYLATACGSIWLAPPGDINLTGLRLEVPFIRGTLDKLGVVPDFDHIGPYKNAKNFYTETAMTKEHREAMQAILDSVYGQVRRGIAEGRKLAPQEVDALIDRGPFLGPQALEARLVDRLGYRDELEAELEKDGGGELRLIKTAKYLKSGRHYDRGPRVALIFGLGGVSRGKSDYDPFNDSTNMGGETVAQAIEKAREDRSIKAIVFRVDSPGGSYVGSDVIWRQVMLTKGVKPIVVSMGDVAGSGGYFVAMAADKIIAQPGTITASIGVVAGKFVTPGFWTKLGITSDFVQRGRHASFFSEEQRYTPEERVVFRGWLERIYKDFVGKVAQGRGKTFEEIDAIAKGRIWSGEDALRLGLIDDVGGLSLAITRALELAKLDPKDGARLVVMPAAKGFMGKFFGGEDETRAAVLALRGRVERFLEEGPALGPEQVLEMPFVPRLE
jgi:protease-4